MNLGAQLCDRCTKLATTMIPTKTGMRGIVYIIGEQGLNVLQAKPPEQAQIG